MFFPSIAVCAFANWEVFREIKCAILKPLLITRCPYYAKSQLFCASMNVASLSNGMRGTGRALVGAYIRSNSVQVLCQMFARRYKIYVVSYEGQPCKADPTSWTGTFASEL